MKHAIDMHGKYPGSRLTGLYPTVVKKDAQYWMFRCDCGNLVEARGQHVRNGHTKSCGCLQKENKKLLDRFRTVEGNVSRLDLFGQEFGRLTAIMLSGRKAANGNLYWLCACRCGNFHEVNTSNLVKGNIVSCGCYNHEMKVKGGTRLQEDHRKWVEWKAKNKEQHQLALSSLFDVPPIIPQGARKVRNM